MIYTDYLIIGLSAAGLHAAQTLRRLNPNASIGAIDAQQIVYNKCLFTSYNSDIKKLEDIQLRKNEWFAEQRIDRYTTHIIYIDSQNNVVGDAHNNQFHYSKLLLALGTKPKTSYGTNDSFLHYHSIQDAQKLNNLIKTQQLNHVVIIGGGLNGIELAHLLYKKNVQVTLLEQKSHLISPALSQQAQLWLFAYYASRINIQVNSQVTDIIVNNGTYFIQTNNNSYTADLVIDCRGVEPNTQWLRNAIECDEKNYIIIDALQRSSIANIYAAGDCSKFKNTQECSKLWTDAALQGIHAAYSMVGISHQTPIITHGGDTKFPDFPVYWRGSFSPEFETIVEKNDTSYREFWRDKQQKLRGFILIGTLKDAGELTQQFLRD